MFNKNKIYILLLISLAILFSSCEFEVKRKTYYYSHRPEDKIRLKNIIDNEIALFGNNINLNHIDTSLITDMSNLFKDYKDFNGNISRWNVSNVTDMSYMFDGASSFNGDISSWITSRVTNMDWMFKNTTSFKKDISKWDVRNVTKYSSVFFNSGIENNKVFQPKFK